jgi:23S rRNA (guanine1835-N2)-methyltransferase
MEKLTIDDRAWTLQRWPLRRDDPLRAWDAADQYMLAHLRDEPPAPDASILIVNDAFGALGVALGDRRPVSWTDSHISRLALAHNLALNTLPDDTVDFVPGDRDPDGPFDLVLIKQPKSLAWFEEILLKVRPRLNPDARIITGGMIKHTPKRVYDLLSSRLGPTLTSLGWKKARLAFCTLDPHLEAPTEIPPAVYTTDGLSLVNRANVFSRERLDAGTRLLLDHLPATQDMLRAADLGCGNGVLGLTLARRCPGAEILFTDASYQAVASARENAARTDLQHRMLRFTTADGLADEPADTLDLVLCNPPFHQDQTVGDAIAWRMFGQARHALRRGGEFRVVGNRHLGYHVKLKRLFGNAEVMGANSKFVVLISTKI